MRPLTVIVAIIALASLLLVQSALSAPATQPTGPLGVELQIDGAIGPATSHYIQNGIRYAQQHDAGLILLRIDTPGGLSSAMRDIIKAMLASPVPVVGYVAPSGARAASAGTYILYACQIAAMAPGTNLGAATPVSIGAVSPMPGSHDKSGQSDHSSDNSSASAERRKVVNDATAYIRGLAKLHHRNADWAATAVKHAASLNATQALQKNVVNLVADSTPDLLAALDGKTVKTAAGEVTLQTAGMHLHTVMPDWRENILAVITDPTIAYILLMIGFYGLILEGFNPGSVVPGVVGAICLLLALFAFQMLPVNYSGMALIALGVVLMISEAFAPSGILALGGMAALILGSLMLMDTHAAGYQLPLAIIVGTAIVAGLLTLLIVGLFLHSRRKRVLTGRRGLVGETGEVLEAFSSRGRVWVHGEDWQAKTQTALATGQAVRVTAVTGLVLTVEPATQPFSKSTSFTSSQQPNSGDQNGH